MNNVIEVKKLVKTYGKNQAVKGIDFEVREGEIFGFLGPNGAGKSTTINILCTMLGRTGGEVYIKNFDVYRQQDEVRNCIGIVFQERTLDIRLTARENLLIHGYMYNMDKKIINKRIDEVLEIVELKDKKKSIVSTFSGGMKRRLEIARGLMHYPGVLFLDEPTTGLDPQTRAKIWDYLLKLKEKHKMTIFLTTHYMDEAEICDNIAIIDDGIIVAYGTPVELKENFAENKVRFRCENRDEMLQYINNNYDHNVKFSGSDALEIDVRNSLTKFVVNLIRNCRVEVRDLQIIRPTLNDVFINITGKNIRE